MADFDTSAPAETPAFAPELPPDTGAISPREAARLMGEARAKAQQPAEPDKPARERATDGRFAKAQESAPQGEDAGPDDQVPGETAQDDPAELPPIDPPRSWSKEDKELFNSLPRETQERVSDRERSRESDFLRRQSEATEKSKALEAKEQAAEQARQQYESAAQNALQVLQQQQASEFADIKTQADVRKLATDDPFRFAQFQAFQMQIQAQAQEVDNLNRQRQESERKTFDTWSKEQDDKFSKRFPEFNDPEKGPKLRTQVQTYLTKEIGVPEDKLPQLWANHLFRDEMFQRVIYDASRFHDAQQRAKSAVAAPKPAPQRPGVASEKGSTTQEAIRAAQQRLNGAKGNAALEAGVSLLRAQRAAARR